MMIFSGRRTGRPTLVCSLLLVTGSWSIGVHADSHHLQPMVVTASGSSQAIADVQASVEVFDRSRIERGAAHNVTSVLKNASGVQANSGGATGSISIRGFNTNQSLILVDGQRRTNNYSSNNPNQLSLYDVERIEVVRGPMSSLYGSDALGGVVNVITRRPGSNPGVRVRSVIGATDGGRETLNTGFHLDTGNERLGHALTLEQLHRQSYRRSGDLEDDKGRLINLSLAYRGSWALDDSQSLDWTLEHFKRDNDLDAQALIRRPGSVPPVFDAVPFSRYEDEQRTFGSLAWERLVGPGELRLRGSYGRSLGSTNRSFPETRREDSDYRQYQTDLFYRLPLTTAHQLALGGGHNRDELDVTINSRAVKRNNSFAFAQDEWALNDAWTLVWGGRYDRFDDGDNAFTPRISLGWQGDIWRGRLGYGEGFRAPSLLEQYASFTRGGGRSLILGNPDLQPERSKALELALGVDLGVWQLDATLHESRVRDLIQAIQIGSEPLPGGGVRNLTQYQNVERARLRGLELAARWAATDQLALQASYDWLDARDRDSDQRLFGRPRHTLRLESQYSLADWNFTLRARHLRDFRSQQIGCRGVCPAYDTNLTWVDLQLGYQWSTQLDIFAGVDNLFDRPDPDNFVANNAGTGGAGNDPDARYLYLGANYRF